MAVTMRDLGKMLGVSAVTISKALAGKGGVSEEMRARIIALAKEVGYVNPNQGSAPNASLDVGILVPEHFFSNDTFYAMFYKQLLQALGEAGHFGMLELITADMQRTGSMPNLLRADKVDALILLGQPEERYTALLASQTLPVIGLDFCYAAIPMDTVVGDNAHGAAQMTRCLIERGHRELGFVGNVKATSSIMERYLGFTAEMLRHDLPIHPEWVLPDRDEHNVLIPIALPGKMPTAFICNCDLTARALITQLEKQGLRVPQDVSVVGYDDFNNMPGSLPLTTFRVDTDAMCRMAVQLTASRCAGDTKPRCRIVVGGEAVYRDSVFSLRSNN